MYAAWRLAAYPTSAAPHPRNLTPPGAAPPVAPKSTQCATTFPSRVQQSWGRKPQSLHSIPQAEVGKGPMSGRLLWASPTLPGSTHDLTAARTHGIVEALAEADLKCWANKAYRGCRRLYQAGLPQPSPQAVATPTQQHACQDPVPWRAGDGHAEGLASPAEASLQHQPHHSDRPGRPRPSSRVSVRLKRAPRLEIGQREALDGENHGGNPAPIAFRDTP